jgi:hypothetical protein
MARKETRSKHHKAKIAFSVVEKARDLKEHDELRLKDIKIKLSEQGHEVPENTLIDWLYYRTRASA